MVNKNCGRKSCGLYNACVDGNEFPCKPVGFHKEPFIVRALKLDKEYGSFDKKYSASSKSAQTNIDSLCKKYSI